jgi:hypothetical protein
MNRTGSVKSCGTRETERSTTITLPRPLMEEALLKYSKSKKALHGSCQPTFLFLA